MYVFYFCYVYVSEIIRNYWSGAPKRIWESENVSDMLSFQRVDFIDWPGQIVQLLPDTLKHNEERQHNTKSYKTPNQIFMRVHVYSTASDSIIHWIHDGILSTQTMYQSFFDRQ